MPVCTAYAAEYVFIAPRGSADGYEYRVGTAAARGTAAGVRQDRQVRQRSVYQNWFYG